MSAGRRIPGFWGTGEVSSKTEGSWRQRRKQSPGVMGMAPCGTSPRRPQLKTPSTFAVSLRTSSLLVLRAWESSTATYEEPASRDFPDDVYKPPGKGCERPYHSTNRPLKQYVARLQQHSTQVTFQACHIDRLIYSPNLVRADPRFLGPEPTTGPRGQLGGWLLRYPTRIMKFPITRGNEIVMLTHRAKRITNATSMGSKTLEQGTTRNCKALTRQSRTGRR